MTVAAVLLAAGAGTRFGGDTHKLRAPFRGLTVVQHALGAALEASLDATYIVTGAVELRDLIPEGVVLVENHSWELGQATSLRAGVFTAENDGHDAVVIGLGDQPLVGPASWQDGGRGRRRPGDRGLPGSPQPTREAGVGDLATAAHQRRCGGQNAHANEARAGYGSILSRRAGRFRHD